MTNDRNYRTASVLYTIPLVAIPEYRWWQCKVRSTSFLVFYTIRESEEDERTSARQNDD